ncbi:MAG: arylsulfatase [Planctomycetaceae bacterium]|nr:arylsulfatase [Planctomycetaceae bacterium]
MFQRLHFPGFLLVLVLLIAATDSHAAESRLPNVIYIMLDDAGYADFCPQGSGLVQTPYFDRMCREGMQFTDHYSGSCVCAPTRCVLMTGLHTGHCRRRDNQAAAARDQTDENGLVFLKDEDVTVAEVLQQAGYYTAGIGKWGLGNPGSVGSPDKQGFDHFLGYLDQVHAHNHYTDWLWEDGNKRETGNRYSHDIFEEETLQVIRKVKDRPFFLYLPYCLPHGDYVIPEEDPAFDLYKNQPWPRQVINYAAMITRADRTVGKILDLLAELNIDQNTLVFYTSDNGPNTPFVKQLHSNAPFQGIKRTLYEGGIRAAMVARWPGTIAPRTQSDFAWDMRDVFPTLCELAGVESPDHLDGISILPILKGQAPPERSHLYWEFPVNSQQAVRIGNWKGLRMGTKSPILLFDLAADPGETKNLASQHPQIIQQMAEIMQESHTPSKFWPMKETIKTGKAAKKNP